MPSVIVMKGTPVGEFFELGAGPNVVGRAPDLMIRLQDMTVSRRHLRIVAEAADGACRVEDLGSTHGVRVNGARIRGSVVLGEGDRITLGGTELLFTRRRVADHAEALAVLNSLQSDLATIDFSASAVRRMARDAASAAATPDLAEWAGAARATLAVVFTDLVASTRQTCELGNDTMNGKRRAHFARVRGELDCRGGREIKSSGDGFLVAFHAAVDAVDFALAVAADPGDADLRLRAGVHVGPVAVEDGDVQGAAVSYAARLLDQAPDGGLWVSDAVMDHLAQDKAARHAGLQWRAAEVSLKGFAGPRRAWCLVAEGGRT